MYTCTKVTLRQRLLDSGKITLYLDYYPAIRNPHTNRSQRQEYLGINIYGSPKNKVQQSFNQRMLEMAELIRCRRQELVIARQFGFMDRHQQREDFLAYFKKLTRSKNEKWSYVYLHFKKFSGGKCTFGEVTVNFCSKFREYLLNAYQLKHAKKRLTRNSASGYFSIFRTLLKLAYKERLLTENINDYLDYIEWEDAERQFLNQDELIQLAQTPCKYEGLRRASLFSCLTGLRVSDILNLSWDNVREVAGIGICLVFKTQKTKTAATLPLCQEAIELMGEHGKGKVFHDFKRCMIGLPLKKWIAVSGIEKHITFHCFRHTYATLQMAANSNPYVVSRALTHKSIGTTLRYTHDIPKALVDTLGKITLKPKEQPQSDGDQASKAEPQRVLPPRTGV